MQLKMTKHFSISAMKQMLLEEEKFISNIFAKMQLPSNEFVAQNGHEYHNEEKNDYKKDKPEGSDKAKRAHTFEELHSRFHEMKGKKLNYKEKLLKKGLRNRMTKKAKKEQRLMKKKLAMTERKAAEATRVKEEGDIPKVPKQKPIFNSQGNMVFSKFDFSEIGAKKRPLKVEKDPKKILKDLEAKKIKVKELEDSGETDKARELKEKDAWQSALAKSTGEKIKDNAELLKKTIKREEQQKKRSHKKWESRKESVQNAIDQRQQKRTENILKRKKDVKTNKLKKAAKKGRIIPGF